MSDVTRILSQIESGDPSAAEQLLPLVYDELRKLAAARLAQEKPGQTLQATALVHEAYLRLVDVEKAQHWDSRGHFFAAAAEAMRRILVEIARRESGRSKRGGELRRVDLGRPTSPRRGLGDDSCLGRGPDEACAERSQGSRAGQAALFRGLTIDEAAEVLGISPRNCRSVLGLRQGLASRRNRMAD